MIIDAVFKEEEALNADFGVLSKGEKGDKGDAGVVDYSFVANALKGSASGNPIVLSDVSPLPHEIKVKLGGKFAKGEEIFVLDASGHNASYETTITESGFYTFKSIEYDYEQDMTYGEYEDGNTFESFYWEGEPFAKGETVYIEVDGYNHTFYKTIVSYGTVHEFGKNLFDASRIPKELETNGWKEENGYLVGEAQVLHDKYGTASKPFMSLEGCDTVTVSYRGYYEDAEREGTSGFHFRIVYEDGTNAPIAIMKSAEENSYSATSSLSKKAKSLCLTCSTINTKTYLKDIQVEVGTTATEYEPYKGHTEHTADGNGIVHGIIGNGEGITLIAEDGVTMNVQYNKDLNKAMAEINQKLTALSAALIDNV